ncbi:hypothetical protein ACYZT8_01115 [Pseudomonas sp. LB3P93]
MMLRPMAGGLHRVEVFGEGWVIRVKKMLGPGGLGIFFDETAATFRVSACEGFSEIVRFRNGFVQKARFMIVFEQVKSFLCVWGQFDGANSIGGAQSEVL